MMPDYRAALLVTATALPAGSAVPVMREMLIELLNGSSAPTAHQPDRMLTAEEVAPPLGTTLRWVYVHADQLGGTNEDRSRRGGRLSSCTRTKGFTGRRVERERPQSRGQQRQCRRAVRW
jgi:hypothetical protein